MSVLDDHPAEDSLPAPTPGVTQKFVKWKGRGNKREVSAAEILKEREEAAAKHEDMPVEDAPPVDAPPVADYDVAAGFEASAPPPPAFTRMDMRPKGVNMHVTPNVHGMPSLGSDGFSPPELSYKTARTLTDWLAICPGLRQPWESHPYRIRVERMTPKVYGGMRVGGFLGYERDIDDENFAIQYGGEKFRLTLEGPDPRGISDPMTGLARIRTLASMEVEVPGIPNLQKLPLAVVAAAQQQQMEGNAMQQPFSPFAPPQHFQPPQRMDAHEARGLADITRELLKNQMRDRSNGADGAVLEQFGRMSEAQMAAAKEMAGQQTHYLNDQLAAERRRAEAMEARLNEMQQNQPQNRMIELLAGGKMTSEETERIRREYEDKIDRQRRDNEALITQREAAWQLRLDQATNEWTRREEMLRTEAARKETDSRDAAERRERDQREHYENKLRLDRDMYEARNKDQTRDHERQVTMMMENNRRETESLRRDGDRDQKTQRQMSEMLVHSKDAELDRLRSENATLKMESEALKREVYKPFAEKLAEGKQVGEMLGMVSASDAAAPEKEEKMSSQLVKMVVDKAPQLLQSFMPIIAQRFGVDAGVVAPAQQPAGLLPGGPPQQQAPQQQQRRRVPPPRRAEPIVGENDQYGVSPDFVPVQGSYTPPQPVPVHPVPAPPQQAQPQAQQAPPAQQQTAPQAQPQAQPQQQAPSETDQRLLEISHQIGSHLNGNPPFPEETLIQFAAQATQARKNDMPAKEFAAGFVEQAGDFAFLASDWIKDSDGGWMVLELVTRGQAGWSMAGPKMWIAEMLVELRRLKAEKTAPAPAPQATDQTS